MSKSLAISSVLLLAGAIFLLGCGDSSESEGTAASAERGAPSSKAAFIKRADEICAKADEDQFRTASAYRKRHEAELNKLSPIAAEEKMIRIFVFPSIQKQIDEIRALGFPNGEEKEIEAILAGLEKALKKAHKDPYAIEGEVPTENPFREIAYRALDYGFIDCRNMA